MKYYLGIDIGTSSVKILAVDEKGKTLARFSEETEILSPQESYQEQDPDAIVEAVIKLLKKATEEVEGSPTAIGISSALHGLICVDKEGKLLTNCWLWSDGRSAEIAQSLRKNTLGDSIFQETGTPIHSMSPLCKIRWLQENQPDIHAKTDCFFGIKSYVVWRLFSEKVVDYSLASGTGLFSGKKMKWDKQALDFCGIKAENLPKPVSTLYKLPVLKPEIIEATGLSKEIPFIAGAADGCLANLGSGALKSGEVCLTIGTSAAIRTAISDFDTANNGSLFTYYLDEKIFLLGGASNNGGNVLAWFTEKIIGEKSVGDMLKQTEEISPGADGLTFLPYIFGERAPLWDATARGTYAGVSASHERAHFAKATVEGILLNLRTVLEEIETVTGYKMKKIIAGGGFFRSKIGTQLTADILGKTVEIRESHDNSAYGAVLQAMKGVGEIVDYAKKDDWWEAGETFLPDVEKKVVYDRLFGERVNMVGVK